MKNIKLQSVQLTSKGNDDFPDQYVVNIGGTEYVTWTPVEINTNDSYDVEFQDIKKINIGGVWKEFTKVRLTKPKSTQTVPTAEPSSNSPTPTTYVTQAGDDVYHKMCFEFLVRNSQLSLTSLNELGPKFKSIMDGTISENDLGELNLKYFPIDVPMY